MTLANQDASLALSRRVCQTVEHVVMTALFFGDGRANTVGLPSIVGRNNGCSRRCNVKFTDEEFSV